MKLVCVRCQIELRPVKLGMPVVEMAGSPARPLRIWFADVWGCKECGFEVCAGFSKHPIEWFDERFARYLESAKAHEIVYDYERGGQVN